MNRRQISKNQKITFSFSNLANKTSNAHHFCLQMRKQIRRLQANSSKTDKFRSRAYTKLLKARPVNLPGLFVSGQFLDRH